MSLPAPDPRPMHELDSQPAWLAKLLRWIAHTTRASRLARLSTIGLKIPRENDPDADRWREGRWLRDR